MLDRAFLILEEHLLGELTLVGIVVPNFDCGVHTAARDQQRALHAHIHRGDRSRVEPFLDEIVAYRLDCGHLPLQLQLIFGMGENMGQAHRGNAVVAERDGDLLLVPGNGKIHHVTLDFRQPLPLKLEVRLGLRHVHPDAEATFLRADHEPALEDLELRELVLTHVRGLVLEGRGQGLYNRVFAANVDLIQVRQHHEQLRVVVGQVHGAAFRQGELFLEQEGLVLAFEVHNRVRFHQADRIHVFGVHSDFLHVEMQFKGTENTHAFEVNQEDLVGGPVGDRHAKIVVLATEAEGSEG